MNIILQHKKFLVRLFSMIFIFQLFLQVFATGGVQAVTNKITYLDMVNRMTNLETLATPALPGEKCSEFSSHQKTSQYNATTQRYENWAANDDDGKDTPRQEDGGMVMADITGAGALVRFWSAFPQSGHVKIFLNGESEPTIDMPFKDYFNTAQSTFPFNLPQLSYEVGRGKNCYIPITFSDSCKVVAYGGCGESNSNWGRYFQINYVTFPTETVVENYSLSDPNKAALQAVNDHFASNISTTIAPYDGAETTSETVTIPKGEKVAIAEKTGSGAITGLNVKINGLADAPAEWKALADMTVSAFWDNETKPSVWTTLGGFYSSITGLNEYQSFPIGVNADGTMYSNWYMPYEDGAKIVIGNDGDEDYSITYTYNKATLASDKAANLMRFHAKQNRAVDPARNGNAQWPDSTFLYTEGKGRFVGTSLHIYKELGVGDPTSSPEWWWGEGDEKFYVDGEKFPSWFGTGSEDYFGYAWGSWNHFSAPYHSQPFTNGGMWGIGNRLNNRIHILDSVPFEQSFNGTMEKYHRDRYSNWMFTNYWYLEKGGVDNYGEISLEDRTSYYKNPYPDPAIFYEGEDIPIIESTGMMKAETQDMSPFPANTWSNKQQLIFKAESASAYVKLRINVPEDKTYNILGRFTKAGDFGRAQHSINGTLLGTAVDLYNNGVIATPEISLGEMFLTKGWHELKVELTGKNNSSSGYFYGLDYLKLHDITEPLPSPSELNNLISACNTLHNSVTEGVRLGRYKSGSKVILKSAITAATSVANKANGTQAEFDIAKATLQTAFDIFKAGEVMEEPSLVALIDECNALYNGTTEGANLGQYKVGSRSVLNAAIFSATLLVGKPTATQAELEAEELALQVELNTFKAGKIESFPKSAILTINGKTYITNNSGVVYKNQIISYKSKQYIANKDGVIQKGKKFVSFKNSKYYIDQNGVIQKKRFITVNKRLYYVASNGKLVRKAIFTHKKSKYYARTSGEIKKSQEIFTFARKKYFQNSKGVIKRKAWITHKGKHYYATAKGPLVQNKKQYKIGKKRYNFNKSGVCTNR